MTDMGHVLALCGGVGGAKLAFGLAQLLAPHALSIVVNTGDDFEHLGLTICPDLDTVCYTLAGLADRERGWGLQSESWRFMDRLARLGGEDWFSLGDTDLATHVRRTSLLAEGMRLSQATDVLARALGIRHLPVPMSDQPVRTMIETAEGRLLSFQHYFVKERCQPVARRVHFAGAPSAQLSPAFADALKRPDLRAILICPSNPFLSVDPILSLPGVRDAIEVISVPVVAVSPIVAGRALKGPAAKMMHELGTTPDQAGIAEHYQGLIDGLVIDEADAGAACELRASGLQILVAPSVMITDDDRIRLARRTLAFCNTVAARKTSSE